MSRRGVRAAAMGAAVAAVLATLACPRAAVATTGSVTLSQRAFPSYFYDTYAGAADSGATLLFSDPVSGDVFEYDALDGGTCTGAAAGGARTDLARYVTNSGTTASTPAASACITPAPIYDATPLPPVAVDHADGLLVVVSKASPPLGDVLELYDESTLHHLGTVALPAGTPATVGGISWSPVDDRIMLLVSALSISPERSLTELLAYRGGDLRSAAAGQSAAPAWSYLVPLCSQVLSGFVGDAPYRSAISPDVFFACAVDPLEQAVAIVDLPLGADDAPQRAVPVLDTTLTVDPQASSVDFLYDTHANRGYLLEDTGYIAADVYDGTRHTVVSQQSMGPSYLAAVGIDDQTGRLYALTTWGLATLDGAATPVPAEQLAPGLRTPLLTQAMPVPVLQPDATHTHPRLLAPVQVYGSSGTNCPAFEQSYCIYDPSVNVYDDQLP